jgi:hypothetical protein
LNGVIRWLAASCSVRVSGSPIATKICPRPST